MSSLRDSFVLLWLFLLPLILKGQVDLFNVSDQYINNIVLFNPAYSGADDALSVNLSSKKQWTGFVNSPNFTTVTLHTPVKTKSIGVGIQVQNMSYGIQNRFQIMGDYSYRLTMNQSVLAFGLSVGWTQLEVRWSDLIANEIDDPVLSGFDVKSNAPSFRLGMSYQKERFFTGFSAINIIPNTKDNPLTEGGSEQNSLSYQLFYNVGYHYDINPNFKLLPSIIARYASSANLQADISTQVLYMDRFGAGLTYRTEGAFITQVQAHVNKQTSFAYSYSFGTKSYSNQLGGSHEISLRYVFNYKLKVENPR